MVGTSEITNSEDIIDSRSVIARIEELEASIDEDAAENPEKPETAGLTDDECEELAALRKLAKEAENLSDWSDGVGLIRDSYFERYAMEFADDIGAIDKDANWPVNCIDWEQAAKELQMDYTAIDFDGVTYWARS